MNAENGSAVVVSQPTCGNDTVIVNAIADTNYHFVNWSDGSTENPYTLVLNGNTTLTANFAIDSVMVAATPENPFKGVVLGGGKMPLGGTTTLIVYPTGNNIFLAWSNGVTDNPYTFTATSDVNLTAMFTLPDTIIYRDTTYINHYIHDTTFVNNNIHDTSLMFVNNYVHDTTFINNYVHDTTILFVNQYVHDTTYINNHVHDTIIQYVNQYVHDTTYINNYIHDTTIQYVNNYVHDTVFINNYIHDTLRFVTQMFDTTIVNNYQFDTMIVNTYTYDTVFVTNFYYDTVLVHDTIYITEQGINGAEELNAKVYTNRGQVVVEGSDDNMVWLYDITGRLLATEQDPFSPIHFDVPASGAYLVKIGNYPARKVVVIR